MGYEADDTHWPLCIDLMFGEGTDQDIEHYNQQRGLRLARGAVHVQVVDTNRASRMNAAQRQMVAAFNKEHREHQAKWLAGVAVITESTVVRGILRAIYWIQPPPYPHAVFEDRDEAMAWAKARLAEKLAATQNE